MIVDARAIVRLATNISLIVQIKVTRSCGMKNIWQSFLRVVQIFIS